VSFAAEAGQLQLNAFEPSSPTACSKPDAPAQRVRTLRERCVTGITATGSAWRKRPGVRRSGHRAHPYIGYSAARGAREALATGKTVYDLVLEKKLLSKEQPTRS